MSGQDAGIDALGLYFRAALSPKNYQIKDVRFLHDIPASVAAFVRNSIQDDTADDLEAVNDEGEAEVSLQVIQWDTPGIFGPTGTTYYLEVIDQDAGALTDSLLTGTASVIAQWSKS
jgi:hypothetical protein